MAEGRLLRNSLLSTTPSQTISTSFQAQEKQAPVPPPGGRGWGGRTKPGFSRRHPNAGRRHSAEHPRAKAHPSLDAVAKITCISEREGEKKQDSDCCTVVSCLPVAWEACIGHLTPGNSGSRADVTGFKTHQELKWSPILHLL